MGNMSNPCINRWGLNSSWHHYWYSDSRYSQNLQQDKIIIELIHTYLTYGTNYTTSLFYNPFWYKTSLNNHSMNLSSYYRWIPMYSEILRTTSYYQFRLTSSEKFNTRISILKYDSWLVVNLYWFQPDKTGKNRLKKAKLRRPTITPLLVEKSTSNLSKLNKLSLSSSIKKFNFKNTYTF